MVRSKWLLFFGIVLSSHIVLGQVNRYVVYFKDKNNSPYSLSQTSQFLSPKSITRREKQNIALSEDDLPVNKTYVDQVKTTGAAAFYTSRWLNCVLVETTPTVLEQIQILPSVKSVELVAPNKKLSGRVRKIRSTKEMAHDAVTAQQLAMLGMDQMHLDGYFGEGVSIAVFDGGFQGVNTTLPFQDLFLESRVKDVYNFVGRSSNVYLYDDHGTEVLSVIGAYRDHDFIGGAYKANFHFYVTEDVSSEYRVEEYNWLFAAERADSAGVDIINSSLGYNIFDDPTMDYSKDQLNGSTAIVSKAAANALKKGMIVVCSAGNEGNNTWQRVTPPADVNGILATGSVTATTVKSSFSSVGPTADNRIKPDVAAQGSATSVIKATGAIGTASGTSLASPLIAALAAGVWQTYPHLTAAEVYKAIIESGTQFSKPDNLLGYGIPNYKLVRKVLESPDINDEIALYPNPVTGSSIKIAIKNPVDTVHVLIYSAEGKRVKESNFTVTIQNNPIDFDLADLAGGTYLIKVTAGANLKTVRIVKL